MYSIKEKIFNKKIIVPIIIISVLLLLPLFEVLIDIIFSYGNLFGTYARYISEGKICLGL